MKGLQDKVAIITGAATLLGAGVARAFVAAGVKVAILDIDQVGGQRVAGELGPNALFIQTDISKDDQVAAAVAQVASRFGGVDYLINLACTYGDSGFKSSRADWLTTLDVNVASGVMLAQAVHPLMKARGGGAIVNFTSISAKVAQKGRWLYPVSKAAIVQLTRNMAMDLAPDHIRVNSVSPGWTWSRLMEQATGGNREAMNQAAAPFHLLGRVADPEEVAQVVLFLCSDNASFVTGSDYAVDGGYSAMGPEQSVAMGGRSS